MKDKISQNRGLELAMPLLMQNLMGIVFIRKHITELHSSVNVYQNMYDRNEQKRMMFHKLFEWYGLFQAEMK